MFRDEILFLCHSLFAFTLFFWIPASAQPLISNIFIFQVKICLFLASSGNLPLRHLIQLREIAVRLIGKGDFMSAAQRPSEDS